MLTITLSTTELLIIGFVILSAGVGGVGWWWYQKQQEEIEEEVEDALDDAETPPEDESGHEAVTLENPEPTGGFWGLVKAWRHQAKSKKMARKGYVKWYKYGASFSNPKWVKPEKKGAGEWEYYDSDDDVTYLFPETAMLNDPQTGAWVCIHKAGEVSPLNLADPVVPAIDADRMDEIIQLEAESDAPGLLDQWDLDPQTLLFGAIGLVLVMGAAMQFMGGGA